jgi:hypothetical protein
VLNHTAALIACRTRLATLEVCTTGSTTLVATTTGYTRPAGSFITDGFQVGQEILPAGFTATTRQVIKSVAAGTILTEGTVSAEASGSGVRPETGCWKAVHERGVAPRPFVGQLARASFPVSGGTHLHREDVRAFRERKCGDRRIHGRDTGTLRSRNSNDAFDRRHLNRQTQPCPVQGPDPKPLRRTRKGCSHDNDTALGTHHQCDLRTRTSNHPTTRGKE